MEGMIVARDLVKRLEEEAVERPEVRALCLLAAAEIERLRGLVNQFAALRRREVPGAP